VEKGRRRREGKGKGKGRGERKGGKRRGQAPKYFGLEPPLAII